MQEIKIQLEANNFYIRQGCAFCGSRERHDGIEKKAYDEKDETGGSFYETMCEQCYHSKNLKQRIEGYIEALNAQVAWLEAHKDNIIFPTKTEEAQAEKERKVLDEDMERDAHAES